MLTRCFCFHSTEQTPAFLACCKLVLPSMSVLGMRQQVFFLKKRQPSHCEETRLGFSCLSFKEFWQLQISKFPTFILKAYSCLASFNW